MTTERPHILMITNHGIHDWEIRSGLIDTGGQNHYVNAMTDTLVDLGFRVTIFNRGGYPDPVTQHMRRGAVSKNDHARIIYLEGGGKSFIRKEDLTPKILEEEANHAAHLISAENIPVELLVTHYWDAAVLGNLLREKLKLSAKHVWIPHSLGALKQRNFSDKPRALVSKLRFPERIGFEREALGGIDYVASTSGDISSVLREYYGREPELLLPPCINTNIIYPINDRSRCHDILAFLERQDPVRGERVRKSNCIILEVSRTDHTKRKDIVVQSFAEILPRHPEAMLLLTLSADHREVYEEITGLVTALDIEDHVMILGSIPRMLMSQLFAIATLYVTPADQESFGMSIQEACACRRPTIASDHVPFAVENLLTEVRQEIISTQNGPCMIQWGKAGVVVSAGNVPGFAYAMGKLLADATLRDRIAAEGYRATIPSYTWPERTKAFLTSVGLS